MILKLIKKYLKVLFFRKKLRLKLDLKLVDLWKDEKNRKK